MLAMKAIVICSSCGTTKEIEIPIRRLSDIRLLIFDGGRDHLPADWSSVCPRYEDEARHYCPNCKPA